VVEDGHCWRAIERQRAVLIDGPEQIEALIAELLSDHPALQELVPVIVRLLGYRMVLIAPLMAEGRVLGVMSLGSQERLDERDRSRFQLLAAQVGLAIERARVKERERKQAAWLALVNEIGRRASATLDLELLLQEAAEAIHSRFGYRDVLIALVDHEANELVRWARAGPYARKAQPDARKPIDPQEGIMDWVALHGETLLANDVTQEPRYVASLPETRSELCIPIRREGQVLGVLNIECTRLNAFDEADVVAMETLADHLAAAIENARLYERIKANYEYFRNIVNGLHDQVLVIDPHYRITDVNVAFLRQTGYMREEVIGRLCYEVTHQRGQPCEAPEHPCPAQQVLRSGQPARALHIHYDSQGKPVWINVAASPLYDREGRVMQVIQAYRDVTAERRLEEKLAAVQALGQELVLSTDEEHIGRMVMDAAEQVLEFQVCALFLVDEEQKRLVCKAHAAGEPAVHIPPLLLEGERGITVAVARSGEPIYLPDVRQDPRYIDAGIGSRSELCVPLKVGGKVIGVLNAESEELDGFDQADIRVFSSLADQAALAIENARLFEAVRRQREELRALAARLAEVEEAERRRLARELHDQVGQNLTALGINLNIVRTQMSQELASPMRSRLDDSLALVEETTERIRGVMAELRPPVLDDYGLVATLHWYGAQFASRTGIAVTVQGEEPLPRLAPPIENALFRITQEALTNVAKHAQATRVTVTVEADEEAVRLIVADDGIGFDPTRLVTPDERQGWGLMTMRERAEAVGGHLHVESAPGQGTQVIVEVQK